MDRPLSAELLVQELSNDVLFMDSQIIGKLSLVVGKLREENTRLKAALQEKSQNSKDFGTQTDYLDSPDLSPPPPVTPPSFQQYVRALGAAPAKKKKPIDLPANLPRLSQHQIQGLFQGLKPTGKSRPLSSLVQPVESVENASGSTSTESGFVQGSGDEEAKEGDSYERMLEKAILESEKTFAAERVRRDDWEVVGQKMTDSPSPVGSRRARTSSKTTAKITPLPSEFIGLWHAVKSGVVERNKKFEWKKCTKAEHRVKFIKNMDGSYTVDHKKFVIGDAVFYEQCSGQRCVVVSRNGSDPTVLVRNASTTYNFVIDGDRLVESFKHDNVEHRIVSVKK